MERPAVPDTVAALETIVRTWIADEDTTLFCGDWSHGGVMELMPRGRGRLSGPRYDGAFAGIRELRLGEDAHHVHLDLGRLTRAWYLLTPSVCYGFRPSFELRLARPDDDPRRTFGLGFALAAPYAGRELRVDLATRYFQRAAEHLRAYPALVSFACHDDPGSRDTRADWTAIDAVLDADVTFTGLRQARARAGVTAVHGD